MKKIYSGATLAAVILDTEDETAAVTRALCLAMRLDGDAETRQTLMNLYAEMKAPAPQ